MTTVVDGSTHGVAWGEFVTDRRTVGSRSGIRIRYGEFDNDRIGVDYRSYTVAQSSFFQLDLTFSPNPSSFASFAPVERNLADTSFSCSGMPLYPQKQKWSKLNPMNHLVMTLA